MMAMPRSIFAVALLVICAGRFALSQTVVPDEQRRDRDVSVWTTIETGEEATNSFSEAQILTAGVSIGKILTKEIGGGWRRGRFEYGFSLIPVFRQFRPQSTYGGGFEPVILRWNSSFHAGRITPYIELAGGGLRTNTNFPAGDTSNFNFTARGGGGVQIWSAPARSIDIACRWSHISNANLGVRNPEFNGIQISVGYHWFR
jgi:hypothetical protein